MRWFIAGLWITLGVLRPAAADFLIPISDVRELYDGKRTQLELPLPHQERTLTFDLRETSFLPPSFTGAIRTLYGRAVNDPACSASVVVTPDSISAQVFHRAGADYLESSIVAPDQLQLRFEKSSHRSHSDYNCLTASEPAARPPGYSKFAINDAHVLREFRMVPAATAEYTEYFGSKEAAIEQLVKALSRANMIFFQELGVSFQLVPGFEQMVFTDKEADPYSTNEPTEQLLTEAQSSFDAMIGTANYDVGIVLTCGTYGLTYIRSVCDPLRKGSNCVGLPDPIGDAFHVSLVTHELAHQFGANHTFNSPSGICAERRNGWVAYEPGSGSTIMGYSTLPCGDDSFQDWHDPYFHSENLQEIQSFLQSGAASCATVIPADNAPPVVDAGPQWIIPIATPFTLTASGYDPDGDGVTFCWEQRDLGPAQVLGAPDNGLSPLFRSSPPGYSPSRTIPALEHILAGTDAPEEQLPQTNRMIHFRVTARDTHHHGAHAFSDTQILATNIAGPFRITSHSEPQTVENSTLIEWSTGGTQQPPVSATQVRILLSTNGGLSFPIVLAASTPNDGSETVALGNVESENARLKVEPTNNIFFDINDAPLRISTDAGLRLSVLRLSGDLRISWRSEPGITYRLQHSTRMAPPEWNEVLATNAATSEVSLSLPVADSASYFRLARN